MKQRLFFSLCLATLLSGCIAANNAENPIAPTPIAQNAGKNAVEQEATNEIPSAPVNDKSQIGDMIFTHSTNKGKLYHHENYSFSYSEEDEQSEWVGYELTKEESYGKMNRSNKFDEDPIVITQSAHPYEYRQSGYTKGHLAPAGDMKFNATAMSECFYMSNMSPQTQKFNSGIWNDLECQVRFWAQKFNSIYVITGPILTDADLPKMTYVNNRGKEENSDITIPNRFYKIVYDFSKEGKEKMIGFIIPQDANGDYFDYAVTVDEIEEITGIDFFHNLSKANQAKLEGNLNVELWKKFTFKSKYNNQ